MRHLTVEQDDKLRSWAVGNCVGGRELPLVHRLIQEGHDAYTPSCTLPARTTVVGWKTVAAFSGYLFISTATILPALADAARWGARFHVLLSGGEFGKVSESYIDALKAREAAGELDDEMEIRCRQFSIGQTIRIENSGYAGLTAMILGFRGKRAKLDIPGVNATHWFPTTILRPVENPV